MRNSKWLFLALLSTLSITSCFIDINDDDGFFGCVDGEGPLVTETLSLPNITGIELDMSAEVILRQGPEQLIEVEGKPNIIDELELDVNNGVWEIDTDGCVRDLGNMKFFITLPEIKSIRLAGSGSIFSENTLVTEDIDISISGSGDLDLALDADDINARISGSGKMVVEGNGDELDLKISGSGDFQGFNLEVREASIEIAGSGDAEITVTDYLNVKIAGSGDVFYRGNPLIDVQISGSGQVIDAN